jgi:predicted AAA+ superfamily ATPase
MADLYERSRRRIETSPQGFTRSLAAKINWKSRLNGIRGARGTGKTTLLLQHIRQEFAGAEDKALYAALDDMWFTRHSLEELADNFVKQGGTHLFLDEVHRYPEWPRVLKNLYDSYPELSIVFTGSSLLTILDARADLSRRALMWTLQGLSFREYLNLSCKTQLPVFSLEDILHKAAELSSMVLREIKPLAYFPHYLKTGYYPYFTEGLENYPQRLAETVSMILEMELPQLRGVNIAYIPKLRQLLGIIAASAPFIPNVSKLAERIGVNRQTLLGYLHYLEEAKLTHNLYRNERGISLLQKPDKIYLENTNLMFVLNDSELRSDTQGTLRETFLMNQLSFEHYLEYPETTDFLLDHKYLIEVGGKSKGRRQLVQDKIPAQNCFVAADNLEYGHGNTVPLWLFGFLY